MLQPIKIALCKNGTRVIQQKMFRGINTPLEKFHDAYRDLRFLSILTPPIDLTMDGTDKNHKASSPGETLLLVVLLVFIAVW